MPGNEEEAAGLLDAYLARAAAKDCPEDCPAEPGSRLLGKRERPGFDFTAEGEGFEPPRDLDGP